MIVLAEGECEAALDSNPRSTGERCLLTDRLRPDDPNAHSTYRDDAGYGAGVRRRKCECPKSAWVQGVGQPRKTQQWAQV